jgi:hypothetical protein
MTWEHERQSLHRRIVAVTTQRVIALLETLIESNIYGQKLHQYCQSASTVFKFPFSNRIMMMMMCVCCGVVKKRKGRLLGRNSSRSGLFDFVNRRETRKSTTLITNKTIPLYLL